MIPFVPPYSYTDTLDDVVIRTFNMDDLDTHYEAVTESISQISPWLPWCHNGYTEAENREWVLSRQEAWENQEEFSFVVTNPDKNILIGSCGINQINRHHGFANLGYWIRTGCTGQGIASKATILTARFAFQMLQLNRLEILAAVGNMASRRVAEKAGAKKEGILRKRLRVRNRTIDAILYSLVPEDLND